MMNFYNLMMIFNFFMFILMMIPSNLLKFHPLILTLMLIIYVVILSLLMNMTVNNYWYSYLLFLILIGGLMILFMYFTSVAVNELMNLNKINMYNFLLKYFFMLMIFLIFYNLNKKLFMNSFLDINSISSMLMLSDLNLKNLYMDYSMDLNLYMILYLFFTMICCVLICMKFMIPFRQLNYYE